MSRMYSVTIDTHADREGYTELEKKLLYRKPFMTI